ncbi:MAG: hypothetical protein AAGN82_20410 [Myxococcota bacterium]
MDGAKVVLALAVLVSCRGASAPADDPALTSIDEGHGGQDAGAEPTGGTGGLAAATGSGGTTKAEGGGAPFTPEPIPSVSADVPPLCADPSPANYFQFLDDTCTARMWPSYVDRDFSCPVTDASTTVPLAEGGDAVYRPVTAPVVVENVLGDVVPAALFVTVILIRRVGGVPHVRYLSNGTAYAPYQPWSTTKFLAAANAAAHLRIQSGYQVGLTARVGSFPLGDLVTSLHNYDDSPFSSNSLGRYFHDIGGRTRANGLIHDDWLERPAAETFGGNYGAAAPSLGYTFAEGGGASVTVSPDPTSGPSNFLSSFTMAEALKRLVLHREVPDQRLPGIQWADVQTLLYGTEGGTAYGPWGGMSADTAIYLQTGHDIAYLDQRAQGRWRVFSKLGLGTQGQFLNVGYGCFPVLDPEGAPVSGWGREMVIATHLASGGATWSARDRRLAEAYRAIVSRVIDGRL